jgi:hypothetical protein
MSNWKTAISEGGYEKGGKNVNWAGLFGAVYSEIAIH